MHKEIVLLDPYAAGVLAKVSKKSKKSNLNMFFQMILHFNDKTVKMKI